jgi:hypothetical protein
MFLLKDRHYCMLPTGLALFQKTQFPLRTLIVPLLVVMGEIRQAPKSVKPLLAI